MRDSKSPAHATNFAVSLESNDNYMYWCKSDVGSASGNISRENIRRDCQARLSGQNIRQNVRPKYQAEMSGRNRRQKSQERTDGGDCW